MSRIVTFILLLLSAFEIDGTLDERTEQRVEIIDFHVPVYPLAGTDVTLHCRFRLNGPKHSLYTVNWWRGNDQFFTYKTRDVEPKTSRIFSGIRVVVANSTAEKVVLKHVTEETSGLYRCEVMGEGPAFKTDVRGYRMTVIVPPRQVEMSFKNRIEPRNIFRIDDYIYVNCTAYRVKPRPSMRWMINGVEVKRTEIRRYRDIKDSKGHLTSSLAVGFLAAKYFINNRAKISCYVTVTDHEFVKEKILFLKSSSSPQKDFVNLFIDSRMSLMDMLPLATVLYAFHSWTLQMLLNSTTYRR